MRAAVVAIAVLALASHAAAECANACSGHGVCKNSDQCDCFPNFNGADCSERVCPYGLAFIDNPRGDLDHNGNRQVDTPGNVIPIYTFSETTDLGVVNPAVTVYSWETFNPSAQAEEGHFYTECSNKGLCDRSIGQCVCFDGYTGSSCQRTTCPNDCSGHGLCRTVDEIAAGFLPTAIAADSMTYKDSTAFGGLNKRQSYNQAGSVYHEGVTTSTLYRLWDQDMAQACVCDPGFSGPDCSRRECPRGDDPLTHRPAECPIQSGATPASYAANPCQAEVQTVTFTAVAAKADWFKILYRDWTGKIWSTDNFVIGSTGAACTSDANIPIAVATTGAGGLDSVVTAVTNALQSIPNSIIGDVTVNAGTYTAGGSDVFTIKVTFTANSGNLYNLEFVNSPDQQLNLPECADINIVPEFITTVTAVDGNTEASTCSNRGLCDYDSGLCKCFKGYYGGDCSHQNALSQ